jgi:hypothetical protein
MFVYICVFLNRDFVLNSYNETRIKISRGAVLYTFHFLALIHVMTHSCRGVVCLICKIGKGVELDMAHGVSRQQDQSIARQSL